MRLHFPIDSENILAHTRKKNPDMYLYNWRTGERTSNKLTEKMTEIFESQRGFFLEPQINIDYKKRVMFGNIAPIEPRIGDTMLKVTWEEGFEDFKVIPLDYLLPSPKEKHWFMDFFLSPDGEWAACYIGGYRTLRGELVEKRVFFHLDWRYPNGISMPIFADGYYDLNFYAGSFVQHPVYGLCFADNVIVDENGEDKQYLQLHRMDDVLAEINRQMLEKAEENY